MMMISHLLAILYLQPHYQALSEQILYGRSNDFSINQTLMDTKQKNDTDICLFNFLLNRKIIILTDANNLLLPFALIR